MIGRSGRLSRQSHISRDDLGRQLDGEQAVLQRVAAEDVAKPGRQDHPKAVVLQCPHGPLARRAGPEVFSGDQDGGVAVGRLVEHEIRIAAPIGEYCVAKPILRHSGTEAGRKDLVGVDIGDPQGCADSGVCGELLHRHRSFKSAGAVSRPVTALAAATAGDTRWVRAPRPCRPSKLRLLVDAARWPGRSRSSLSATHIEQPEYRM